MMNKILILALLITLCGILLAQSDANTISFDQSQESVHRILSNKGFQRDSQTELVLKYKKSEAQWDVSLQLIFVGNKLQNWKYSYTAKQQVNWNNTIRKALEDFHGHAAEYDSDFDEYIIWLPNERAVYINYLNNGNTCTVEYDEDYSYYWGW